MMGLLSSTTVMLCSVLCVVYMFVTPYRREGIMH